MLSGCAIKALCAATRTTDDVGSRVSHVWHYLETGLCTEIPARGELSRKQEARENENRV